MNLVFGDLHGSFARFNQIINPMRKKISRIFQCGDFGYWPKFHNTTYITSDGRRKKYDNYGIKNKGIEIYFCDGNHEDHESLSQLESNEIMPKVFYMKRGSTFTLEDGRVILFIGGAYSIDKRYRTPGIDWFDTETISQRDIENLPNVDIDIVISHTCPKEFFKHVFEFEKQYDSSMEALSYVLEKYKPKFWYFGHFHKFKRGKVGGCTFTALADIYSAERCWIELE